MAGPLKGLRVIDCSRGAAGLIASGFMADQGADVIWVEPPGGDPFRGQAPEYASYNRSKRSVQLDLKSDQGRQALETLLASADVLITAWGSGVAGRLGLEVAGLRTRHPHLVTCSITAYGDDAPESAGNGFESLVAARAGLVHHQDGHRPGPIFIAPPFIALATAELALAGVFAALYRREDDGWGRHIDMPMLDGALAIIMGWWVESEAPASADPGGQRTHRRLIVDMFRCADGEYLAVHTGAAGAHSRLMKILGLDARIKPAKGRVEVLEPLPPEEAEFLRHALPAAFASRPRDEWVADILSADICAVPILRPGEIFRERQPLHNGMVTRVEDPDFGPLLQVASPVRLRGFALDDATPAPRSGEHTSEVLAERAQRRAAPTTAAPLQRSLLDGVKVVDFGTYLAGPFSARLLADLGAEVVKLEPLTGDPLRAFVGGDVMTMRGKRSIAVDLKADEGRDIGRRLAQWADVVMHNMRPGAAERVGLGHADVHAINPWAIYAEAPGWGSSGPDMHRQAFAPMLSAYVGLQYEVAGEGNAPTAPASSEDPVNGMWGAVAVTMALFLRRRGAKGLHVEYPLLNAAMTLVQHLPSKADSSESLCAGRLDADQMGVTPALRFYQTSDGFISVAAATPRDEAALLSAMDAPKLDPLALAKAFAGRTRQEAHAALAAHKVPHEIVPSGPIHADFLQQSLDMAEGRVAVYDHPIFGRTRQAILKISSPDAPAPDVRRPCVLGEHTREILAMLGYEGDSIESLHDRKIVMSSRLSGATGTALPYSGAVD